MTVSSGFFNSVNHDRVYDAEQFGAIFEGVINNGVYEHVGEAFKVMPNSDVENSVIIGTGRAWFDRTWIRNDAQFSLTLNPPTLIAPRIDAIVFDVDKRDSVRKSSIIVVEGTAATSPERPSMIHEELHNQYPFAYVELPAGESITITSDMITYNVGGAACPLVTGPLEVMNSDNFLAQMDAKFNIFKNGLNEEFTIWFDGIKDLIDDFNIGNINLVNSVDDITIEWPSDTKKLQVKDRGITKEKLSLDLQSIIGVLDPADWTYQEIYDHVNGLPDFDSEWTFINQYLTSSMVNSWTSSQVIEFYGILKNSQSKEKLWDVAPLESYSILEFRDILNTYGSGKYSESIGKKFAVDMGDTYGIHNFILIGMNADTLASGGNAFMTFQSEDIVAKQRFDFDNGPSYSESPICDFVEGLIDYFPMSLQTEIKSVVKYEGEGQGEHSFNSKIWIMSLDAFAESSSINHADDPVYDYWSDKSLNTTMKPVENYGKTINIDTRKMFNNTPYSWILRNPSGTFGSNVYRDVFDEYGIRSYLYRYADTTETWFNTQVFGDSSNLGLVKPENLPPSGYVPGGHGIDLGDTAGIVPCFCI